MSRAITGVGTLVKLGPRADTVPPLTFTLLGELASLTPRGREYDINDVTSFTSPTKAKEKIKGLLNPGQYDLVGNRIFDDASQIALNNAFLDKRMPYWFQVWLPLNPGQAIREIWQFAALVLSIDPPKLAPQKAIQFFSKLQATSARLSFKGWVNATGAVTMTSSRPISGSQDFGVLWSDFAIPDTTGIASDAEIVAIYPVLICNAVHDGAFSYFKYGTGMSVNSSLQGTPFGSPFDPHQQTFTDTEFYDLTIGSSLSALTGQGIHVLLEQTLVKDGLLDAINASAAGFLVVYNSAAPLIDPSIPLPFALSPGQGAAWAVPTTVEFTTGFTNGTATGTPAMESFA